MKFKATLASLAAASFVLAQPVAAAQAVSADRLASPTEETEGAFGSAVWIVLAFVGLLALGEVTDVFNIIGDDEEPTSP